MTPSRKRRARERVRQHWTPDVCRSPMGLRSHCSFAMCAPHWLQTTELSRLLGLANEEKNASASAKGISRRDLRQALKSKQKEELMGLLNNLMSKIFGHATTPATAGADTTPP